MISLLSMIKSEEKKTNQQSTVKVNRTCRVQLRITENRLLAEDAHMRRALNVMKSNRNKEITDP